MEQFYETSYTPTCTAACTSWPPRPPRPTRRPGAKVARFINARPSARSSSPRTPPRRSTSSPTRGAGPTCGDGRRHRAHPPGAPRQHRALADAGGRARHRDPLGAAHRRRPARPHRPRPAARRGQGVRLHRHVQRARHASTRCASSADAAHAHGALAVVDACQYVPHLPTDVQAMGADFVAFIGHKMCGPTGIGVLWGREELLEAMPPFLGGGDMIADVRLDGFTPAELPGEVRGRHAAHRRGHRPRRGRRLPHELGHGQRPGPRDGAHPLRHRPPQRALRRRHHHPRPRQRRGARAARCRFAFRDIHPHDLSQVLDQTNVCVRAGHHCAKPLMRQLGVNATARASSTSTTTPTTSTPWPTALDARRRLLRLLGGTRHARPRRPLPRDHPRPLPQPPEPRRAARRRRRTAPRASTRCAATRCRCTSTSRTAWSSDIRVSGQGCSISQSSASMMSAAVKGKSVDEARLLRARVQGDDVDPRARARRRRRDDDRATRPTLDAEVKLGDLEALRGVVKFPVRIKCATLAWNTLVQGLDEPQPPRPDGGRLALQVDDVPRVARPARRGRCRTRRASARRQPTPRARRSRSGSTKTRSSAACPKGGMPPMGSPWRRGRGRRRPDGPVGRSGGRRPAWPRRAGWPPTPAPARPRRPPRTRGTSRSGRPRRRWRRRHRPAVLVPSGKRADGRGRGPGRRPPPPPGPRWGAAVMWGDGTGVRCGPGPAGR